MTDPKHTEPGVVVTPNDSMCGGLYPVHGSVTYGRIVECCDFCGLPADYEPARTAAEAESRQEVERLREALAETREMLGLCEQIICDETCPTTWRTADGQPHGQMHKDICDVLARHEHHIHPARAALSPAAKGGDHG